MFTTDIGGSNVLLRMHFHDQIEVIYDELPLVCLIFSQPRAAGGTALFGDNAVLDWLRLIRKAHPYTAVIV